eukprot:Hpha_TRINITY_DN15751_c1_g5::TRINITY_DN15751_c1_g5_i1::g.40797::m.40797
MEMPFSLPQGEAQRMLLAGGGAVSALAACTCLSQHRRRQREAAIVTHELSQPEEQHELWTPQDVACWLASKGLPVRQAGLFERQRICGVVLAQLSDQSLKDVGLRRVGDRLKVLAAVESLRADSASAPASVPRAAGVRDRGIALAPVSPARSPATKSPRSRPQPTSEELSRVQEQLGQELCSRLRAAVELMASPALQKLPLASRREKIGAVVRLVGTVLEASEELPASVTTPLVPLLKNAQEMLSLHDQMMTEEGRIQDVQQRQAIAKEQLAAANGGAAPTKRLVELKRLQQQLAEASDADMGALSKAVRAILTEADNFTEQELEVLRELMATLQDKNADVRARVEKRKAEAEAARSSGTQAGEKVRFLLSHIEGDEFPKASAEAQEKALRLALGAVNELSEEEVQANAELVQRLIQVIEQRAKQARSGSPKKTSRASGSPRGPSGQNSALEQTVSLIYAMTQQLVSPAFEELSVAERVELLSTGFKMAEDLPEAVARSCPEIVSGFVSVLKQRRDELPDLSAAAEGDDDEEEEAGDDEDEPRAPVTASELGQVQAELGKELTKRLKAAVELMASPALQKLPILDRREKLQACAKLVGTVLEASEELPEALTASLIPLLKNAQEMLTLHDQMMTEEARIQDVQQRQAVAKEQLAAANGGVAPTKRLMELKRLRQQLAEADDSDMGNLSKAVRGILAETDDFNEQELDVLKDLLQALQERNEVVRARVEKRKREARDKATSNGSPAEKKLRTLLDHIESDDFSKDSIESQEGVLRLALEAVNELSEDEVQRNVEVVQRLVQLVEQRATALRRSKPSPKRSSNAGGSPARSPTRGSAGSPKQSSPRHASPKSSKGGSPKKRAPKAQEEEEEPSADKMMLELIASMTKELVSPEFDDLPLEERVRLLATGFKMAEDLSKLGVVREFPEIVRGFYGVLKQRQAELAEVTRQLADGAEEEDDEEDDEDGDLDDKAAESVLDIVPRVQDRLMTEDFAETTSKAELEAITWVLAETSREIGAAGAERLVHLVQPVHELFALRLKEVSESEGTSLALRGSMPFGVLSAQEAGKNVWEIRATSASGEPELSAVPNKTEPQGAAAEGQKMRAILVAVGDGTEELEMKHLASVLKDKYEVESEILSGPDATARDFLEAIIPPEEEDTRLLVYYRGDHEWEGDPTLYFSEGESVMSNSFLEALPKSAVVIHDIGNVWTVMSPAIEDQKLQLRMADVKAREVFAPETGWMFGNTFTTIFTQLMADKDEAPRSASELMREMILCVTSNGPQLSGDSKCASVFDKVPIAP